MAPQKETLAEQLARTYVITTHVHKYGTQFTLTIPSRIGEQWVERFGTAVRFELREEGLMIKPVLTEAADTYRPSWMQDEPGD